MVKRPRLCKYEKSWLCLSSGQESRKFWAGASDACQKTTIDFEVKSSVVVDGRLHDFSQDGDVNKTCENFRLRTLRAIINI